MIFATMVSLVTVIAVPQDAGTRTCDEVCEAVLTEALDWTLEQVQDLPEFWGSDRKRMFLDLSLRPEDPPAREAEYGVLGGLARSRDLSPMDENHPAWVACREARGSQGCRIATGMIRLRVGTVEVTNPREATVNSTISVMGGGGKTHFLIRRLYMERVSGAWQVVRVAVLARS